MSISMVSKFSFSQVVLSLLAIFLINQPTFATESIFRFYTSKSLGDTFTTNINLKGNILHIAKFKFWLNKIAEIPIGKETLTDIISSPHQLTIVNNQIARVSAGRTMADMTMNLINGNGDDVEIWFDASISEIGSHMVYDSKRNLVEYTAVENLFHELVHAKHKMKGTWCYFDSEGQAIREENIFRAQYDAKRGRGPTERTYKNGIPIEEIAGINEQSCDSLYKIRTNPPLPINKPCS